jgi:glutamine synthetase
VTLDELREAVTRGTVDTVLLAMTDVHGRLQGNRVTATHFLDEVIEHGAGERPRVPAAVTDQELVRGFERL